MNIALRMPNDSENLRSITNLTEFGQMPILPMKNVSEVLEAVDVILATKVLPNIMAIHLSDVHDDLAVTNGAVDDNLSRSDVVEWVNGYCLS
jgi:hypothetical protein